MATPVETDVIVIGAGLAGLTAANRCRQQNLRVVVAEAGEDAGYLCNSRIASGSFNLAHTDPTLGADLLYDAILGDTEGAADPAQGKAIASVAGEAMRWFRDEGAKFIRVNRPGRQAATWSMAPPRPASPGFGWEGRGPDQALRALATAFVARGGTLSLATRALDLTFADGACVGITASKGGADFEIRARHVVLADGGFQGNLDLVRRFILASTEKARAAQRENGVRRCSAHGRANRREARRHQPFLRSSSGPRGVEQRAALALSYHRYAGEQRHCRGFARPTLPRRGHGRRCHGQCHCGTR